MPTDRRLQAQISKFADDDYVASYVVVMTTTSDGGRALGAASSRTPVSMHCPTEPKARRWVKEQAAAHGIDDIEWLLATVSGVV